MVVGRLGFGQERGSRGVLSLPLLVIVLIVGVLLALAAPLYSLVGWKLLLSYNQGFWSMAGIRFDYIDVIIGCLVLGLLLRGQFKKGESRKVPYLFPWFMLGMFLSMAYLVAPQNQDNLTDPFRIGYQLYRYCWKPLAFYPLVVILLRDPQRLQTIIYCMVLGFDICAIEAVRQGYDGVDATPGPFGHGNAFASVLVAPLVLSCATLLFTRSWPQRIFFGSSAILMARALLFCKSRAGMASVVLSLGFMAFWFIFVRLGRTRILQAAPVVLVGVLAIFAIRPDILQRSSVQHALSMTDGTKASTMQWRMTERWPHFIGLALKKPILGTGTAVDRSLGERANTPHNGYIALAVRVGFPAAFLYIFFGAQSIINGVRAFLKYRITRLKIFAIMSASPLIGIMAHNMIESTITGLVLLQNFFWMLCGFCTLARFFPEKMSTPEEVQALAKVRAVEEAVWSGKVVPPPGKGWGDSSWADEGWVSGHPAGVSAER